MLERIHNATVFRSKTIWCRGLRASLLKTNSDKTQLSNLCGTLSGGLFHFQLGAGVQAPILEPCISCAVGMSVLGWISCWYWSTKFKSWLVLKPLSSQQTFLITTGLLTKPVFLAVGSLRSSSTTGQVSTRIHTCHGHPQLTLMQGAVSPPCCFLTN